MLSTGEDLSRRRSAGGCGIGSSATKDASMSTDTPARLPLVTGGSRGLGRNAALHLARAGHDVIVTYRERADEAAAVQREIESIGRRAGVLALDAADVASFAGFASRLDALLQARWQRT